MDNSVLLPGDQLPLSKDTAALGPGLTAADRESTCAARCTIAGVHTHDSKNRVWVDYSSRRYVAVRHERVLGVVLKTGRQHRVDIGASAPASLPELAFEGATKRNRPNLQVGEMVYARVSRAHKHMEPELCCVETNGKANGLGKLDDTGYMLHCSLGLCRNLLRQSCPVLRVLRNHFKFECTVGMNGRVWVNSISTGSSIAVVNAIQNSEFMSPEQCTEMVQRLVERI